MKEFLKNLSIRKKLTLGFGVVLTLLTVSSIIILISIKSMIQITGWVTHTHEAIEKANRIGAAMVDQETGMRGFLVTGKDEYLEPYNSGKDSFNKTISLLKKQVSDNPTQVGRLEKVEKLATLWLNDAADVQIELKRSIVSGSKESADLLSFMGEGVGKKYMDELRSILVEFIDAEASLLVVRDANMKSISKSTFFVIIIGAIISLIFGVFVSIYISNDVGASIAKAVDIAEHIAQGDLSKRMNITTDNEIGKLSKSLDAMSESLTEKESVAQKIAGGNLAVELKLASENDQLGHAFQKMIVTLNDILGKVQLAGSEFTDSSANLSSIAGQLFEGASTSASSLEEATFYEYLNFSKTLS